MSNTDKKIQILEAIDDSIFGSDFSERKITARKVAVSRTLEKAKEALEVAGRENKTELASKLESKIKELELLLKHTDLTDIGSGINNNPDEENSEEANTGGSETSEEDDSDSGVSSEDSEVDADKKDSDVSGDSTGKEADEDESTEKDSAENESTEDEATDSTNDDSGLDSESDEDNEGDKESRAESEDSEVESEKSESNNDKEASADKSDQDANDAGSGDAGDSSASDSKDSDTESKDDKSSSDSSTDSASASDSSDGDEGDSSGDDSESDYDTSKPKTKDNKILMDPFANVPEKAKVPKDVIDELKKAGMETESVFEAAKRILNGLSGDARRGALNGLKDLLAKRGYTVTESLTKKTTLSEGLTKTLLDMSDEEFGNVINSAQELIDSVIKVEYSDDLDDRVKAIQKDSKDAKVRLELDKEDAEHVKYDRDRKALKAYEKENTKYNKVSGLAGLDIFKNTLYRCIKDQVEKYEDDVDSWAALDRRHEDDPSIIKKGSLLDDVDGEIPTVNVYFDQSGSWSESDIAIGRRAISTINQFHEKGQIKLNIFYISAAGVCTDAATARRSGAAEGWAATLEHIRKSGVKNAVILSDRDLDYFEHWNRPTGDNGRTIIDGCVWWLWKNASVSKKALKELIGRQGNFQYYFEGGSRY